MTHRHETATEWGRYEDKPLPVEEEVELKVRIPKRLLHELDEYRHEGRFRSRKAAVVRILKLAFDRPSGSEPGLFD